MPFASHSNDSFKKVLIGLSSFFLLGVTPLKNPFPEIVNHTKSLIVERVDEDDTGYYLTVRSTSPLAVYGLALAVIGENGLCDSHTFRPFSGSFMTAQESHGIPPLEFPTGGFGDGRGVCSATEDRKPGSDAPNVSVTPRIVIEALVFEDGTYDGDPARAERIEAEHLGRRRQFQRIAAQVEEEISSPGPESGDWIAAMTRRVSALSVEPEPDMVHSVEARFGATGTSEELIKRDIGAGLGLERVIFLNHVKIYAIVSSKMGQTIVSLPTWWAATHGGCDFYVPQCANESK